MRKINNKLNEALFRLFIFLGIMWVFYILFIFAEVRSFNDIKSISFVGWMVVMLPSLGIWWIAFALK